MNFIEVKPGVDPEVHEGRSIMARVLVGLGGVAGQPGLNDLSVEVAVAPRYYARSPDFALAQGQTRYVDLTLGPATLGADAGVQGARVVLSSRSKGALDTKDFAGAVTLMRAAPVPPGVPPAAAPPPTVPTPTGVAPPPAPAPAAPPGPAGWPTRISQATSVAQLEAVRAEFEGAYLAKQIDQATYLALYNQYTARYAQVA